MQTSQDIFHFEAMMDSLRSSVASFPDKRTGKNKKYTLMDATAGAFSVFFTQCDSFLEYQRIMEARYGLSNARTLFRIQDIPSDTHIIPIVNEFAKKD